MTKLIIACCDFANTPNNAMQIPQFQAVFYPIFRRGNCSTQMGLKRQNVDVLRFYVPPCCGDACIE